ncbi:DUF202 domain-containing protein [Paractinoplanes ferrugineus]|uniref:DUF202 domain-containing protein n=1 Tax=Paractinoplanes ferrugineus TaxID=113564 RepID=A0A919IUZ6_9ACTN|nr:DUF202 domain-containing protein [Actinoplanes ferrugineus]GIE08990.1 hypothetical protein Afe05nite_08300 [Actinoplanes ferrugineus]
MSPDPGASAERTRLAWRRTGMSATAVCLLAARPAFRPDAGALTWLTAALAMAAWVAMIGLAYRRSYALRRTPPQPARRAVPAYALIAATIAVLGGLVVML